MSHETILYGRISGSHGTTDNWYDLYKLNKNVIENLPNENDFPSIIKSMFISPLTLAGPTFHRHQIITFGASFKNFDDLDHRLWISKFELLLKRMYWLDVIAHFDIELYGKYEHRWTATETAIKEMRTLNPKPITDWVYTEKQID
jgi:hypothetical protein